MFCPKCGRINPDDNELCAGCGSPLHEEKEETNKKNSRGTRKKVVAAAIVLAAVLAVLALGITSCEAAFLC